MARVPGILILASLSFLRVTRPSLLEEGQVASLYQRFVRSNSLSVDNMIIRLIVGLATVQERIQFVKECVTSGKRVAWLTS